MTENTPAETLPPMALQSDPPRAAKALEISHIDGKEFSKNAAKKAAKQQKLAAEKANKAAGGSVGGSMKDIGKTEAKQPGSKAPKKKPDGAGPALIAIGATKDEDFASWYQQVLTKGDMLDYYDVSGCYILKVYDLGP